MVRWCRRGGRHGDPIEDNITINRLKAVLKDGEGDEFGGGSGGSGENGGIGRNSESNRNLDDDDDESGEEIENNFVNDNALLDIKTDSCQKQQLNQQLQQHNTSLISHNAFESLEFMSERRNSEKLNKNNNVQNNFDGYNKNPNYNPNNNHNISNNKRHYPFGVESILASCEDV